MKLVSESAAAGIGWALSKEARTHAQTHTFSGELTQWEREEEKVWTLHKYRYYCVFVAMATPTHTHAIEADIDGIACRTAIRWAVGAQGGIRGSGSDTVLSSANVCNLQPWLNTN